MQPLENVNKISVGTSINDAQRFLSFLNTRELTTFMDVPYLEFVDSGLVVVHLMNKIFNLYRSMSAAKKQQCHLWQFQTLLTFLVYVPTLIIVAILVNFYKGFQQSPGTIYDNQQFNIRVSMSIATGLISLLLSMKPDILDLVGT